MEKDHFRALAIWVGPRLNPPRRDLCNISPAPGFPLLPPAARRVDRARPTANFSQSAPLRSCWNLMLSSGLAPLPLTAF